MAESYVTKFTKYVEGQRKQLYNKLKQKDLIVEPNETLASLVSQIDLLSDKYKPHKYERDPNLPDLDEMFDNDTLRAINGGQYKACQYTLMMLDVNGNVGLGYQSSTYKTMRYYADKIVFGDGVEYEKSTTSALIHSVGENGIYTTSNGDKYTVVKFYKEEPFITLNNTYLQTEPFFEVIDDFFVGRNVNIDQTAKVTGYSIDASRSCIKYFRYVGSNNSQDNIFNATSWVLGDLYYCKNIIIEGVHRFSSVSTPYETHSIVFNGTLFGSSATATTASNSVGYTGSITNGGYCDFVKFANSDLTVSATIGYASVKNVFFPETIFNTVSIHFPETIETLHIGSNIIGSITAQRTTFYSLKNVTVSDNAFHLNTSAITIDFARATLLTRESVLNMFNNFADRTGMTANILKLPAGVKSMMTDEEKLILTNKNWTLS